MTTAGITKRPAPVLEALGRGVVHGVLGVTFAVATVLLASAKGGPVEVPPEPNAPRVWQATGTGDDTTIVVDVAAGKYIAGWEAACPASVLLVGWDDGRTSETLLGDARTGAVPVTLTEGGYFFDMTAACDWTVRLSPT